MRVSAPPHIIGEKLISHNPHYITFAKKKKLFRKIDLNKKKLRLHYEFVVSICDL